MRTRWLGPRTAWTGRTIGLMLLVAVGCSQEEELKPDPGVSPFYPGPTTEAKAPAGAAGAAADRAGAGAGATGPEGPLRPEDVERQLRIAMRTIEKGDSARAAGLLDRILAVEPTNREALLGRAAIALEQQQRAASPDEKAAALEQAGALVRRLRRSYEKSNKRELELFGHVLYEELRRDSRQGRYDRAVATLKEVHDAGFEPFNRIENDKELAGLRASPNYRAVMEEIDAAELARARDHLKSRFSRPMDFAFGFNVKDVDGKSISLEQFKGKVVLIDIWGTWCEPCRKAIPGLAQLYFKYRRHGFEVIGLTIEQSIPDPEEARRHVKKFVQESGIPYRIAMGDDPTLKQLPNYPQISFPTTLLIDRAGKVRVFFGQNSEEVLPTLDDASAILLAEPAPAAPKPADSKAAPKPPADSKAAPKPPADTKAAPKPPADTKAAPKPPA